MFSEPEIEAEIEADALTGSSTVTGPRIMTTVPSVSWHTRTSFGVLYLFIKNVCLFSMLDWKRTSLFFARSGHAMLGLVLCSALLESQAASAEHVEGLSDLVLLDCAL